MFVSFPKNWQKKNQLKVGDHLQFHSVKAEEPVQEATIVGIYQVKEQMKPYMSGDTYRSENVFSRIYIFLRRWSRMIRCMKRLIFKVANVDDYDAVKEAIKKTDINWQWYDLIDNNGNLDTMASNFNDLKKISNTLLLVVTGASFVILFLIFIFWNQEQNK